MSYSNLIDIIKNDLNNKDRIYIEKNQDEIVQKLKSLSKYVNDIIKSFSTNSSDETIKYLHQKYNKMLSFDNLRKIKDILEFKYLSGGEAEKLADMQAQLGESDTSICLQNIPLLVMKILLNPKYLFIAIDTILKKIYSIFNISFSWLDFTEKLDWVYIYLFISASFPFLGGFSNFLIIIKSLMDRKYFLTISTMITTIISYIFTLHIVDLGVFFKMFYYLDSGSYNNAYIKNKDTDEYTNDLNQNVSFVSEEKAEETTKSNSLMNMLTSDKAKQLQELGKDKLGKLSGDAKKQLLENSDKMLKNALEGKAGENIKNAVDLVKTKKDIENAIDKVKINKAIDAVSRFKKKLNKYDKSSEDDYVDKIHELRNKLSENLDE
jgi:hypothetical protein